MLFLLDICSIVIGNYCVLVMHRGKKHRGYILSAFLVVLIISLGILYLISRNGAKLNLGWTLVLLSVVGFSMTGPYSLTSLFSLDLGGKKGSSTISSLNDR